jgi:hypothetical protein
MPQPRDQASTNARRRLARGGAIGALAVLLTTAFTYPIAPRLGSVGRFDTGDGHWSIWCVAWVSHALAADPAHLFDANIFVPHRDTLAYSENNVVAGVLGLPAYLLTGNPYATHNLSMLLGIGLAFAGAYALFRYLTRDTGAAIVAAIGFAFCPFLFARTAHIQLMLFFGLPIALRASPYCVFGLLAHPPANTRAASKGSRTMLRLRLRSIIECSPFFLKICLGAKPGFQASGLGGRCYSWLCRIRRKSTALLVGATALTVMLLFSCMSSGFQTSSSQARIPSRSIQRNL